MMDVTKKAKERLEGILRERRAGDDSAVRIVTSTADDRTLRMILDKPEEGDTVVTNDNGRKVLLMEQSLAESLDGNVLDHSESGESTGFVLTSADALHD